MLLFMGIALIAVGIVYQGKPNLFRRWIWMRTSLAIRLLSPQSYERYIRGLGILHCVFGVAFVVYSLCFER